jgi:hypothetical protein
LEKDAAVAARDSLAVLFAVETVRSKLMFPLRRRIVKWKPPPKSGVKGVEENGRVRPARAVAAAGRLWLHRASVTEEEKVLWLDVK